MGNQDSVPTKPSYVVKKKVQNNLQPREIKIFKNPLRKLTKPIKTVVNKIKMINKVNKF